MISPVHSSTERSRDRKPPSKLEVGSQGRRGRVSRVPREECQASSQDRMVQRERRAQRRQR